MARIDRLQPADRTLMRRASVLGAELPPALPRRSCSATTSRPRASETWDAARRLLRRRRRRLRCASGATVVRDAAYAGLPFRVRRRLHAVAGAQLERELGADADDEAAALASTSARRATTRRRGATRAWRPTARVERSRLRRRRGSSTAARSRPPRARRPATRSSPPCGRRSARPTPAPASSTRRTRRFAPRAGWSPTTRSARRGCCMRHAQVAERAGRVVPAVRWARRGAAGARGRRRPEPRAAAARSMLSRRWPPCASARAACSEAIALCRAAIAEAEAAGEDAALAHACFILDWALVDSGRAATRRRTRERALDDLRARSGELDRQAAVLNNLGGFAYHEGRWDDAVELYRRGAEASERAGDVANAAFGDCNVGEVLADQGRLGRRPRPGCGARCGSGAGRSYEWGVAFADRAARPRTRSAPAATTRASSCSTRPRRVPARCARRRRGAGRGLPRRGARLRGRARASAGRGRPAAARTPGRTARAAAPRARLRARPARATLDGARPRSRRRSQRRARRGATTRSPSRSTRSTACPARRTTPSAPQRRRVRDGMLQQLDVVAVPAPPWTPAVPAGSPA